MMFLPLALSGCGGGGKAAGSEGGACYPNSTCNAGLACLSKLCVVPSGGGGRSGSGTGGSAGSASIGGAAGLGGTTGAAGAAAMNGAAGAAGGGGMTGEAMGGTTGVGGAAGAAPATGTGGGAAGGAAAGGAAAGGTTGMGGAAGGAAAAGGMNGSGGGSGCGALIDDMEDGTGRICQGSGRNGKWFSYRDGNSTLAPSGEIPAPSAVSPPRGSSQRAMHTYGTFVQYAGIGCTLTAVPQTQTFSAAAYTGIQFYAKGTATALTTIVQTASTESTTYGGRCALATLSCAGNSAPVANLSATDWTLVKIPFSSLANGTAPFDRTDIWSVEFQPGAGVFDFWIDDLSFY